MKSRQLVVIALVLLACAWSAAPAPPPIFSPAAPVYTAATCGSCSQSICAGKGLNSICGAARLCQQVGTCAATAVPHCECLAPPAGTR